MKLTLGTSYDKYGHEHDEYEFDLRDWHCESWGLGTGITLTRKKPRVKVEYGKCSRFGDGLGEDGINFERHGYGMYYLVQFRVTGWNAEESVVVENEDQVVLDRFEDASFCRPRPYDKRHTVFIGLGARDKWSVPVLLPESVYSRLDEICRALEEKANGGKG